MGAAAVRSCAISGTMQRVGSILAGAGRSQGSWKRLATPGAPAWRATSGAASTGVRGLSGEGGSGSSSGSASAVQLSLYRTLLRVAAVYDGTPALKAFIRRPQEAGGGRRADADEVTLHDVVDGFAGVYLKGREFYRPGGREAGGLGKSMVQFVKDSFRDDWSDYYEDGEDGEDAEGGNEEVEAAVEVAEVLEVEVEPEEEPVELTEEESEVLTGLFLDAGFAWLAELNTAASVAGHISAAARKEADEGGRVVDYPSIGGLSGTLTASRTLDVGGLLLEHPARAAPGAAVLMVTHVDPESYITAICVNRPLPARGSEMLPSVQGTVLGDILLWSGGEDSGEITILHGFEALEGATPLAPGVFFGANLDAVTAMIESGEATPADFKLVAGSYRWKMKDDMELRALNSDFIECTGSAAAEMALCPPVVDMLADDDGSTSAGGLLPGEFHMEVAWSHALRLLGEEFAEFSTIPRRVMFEYERHRESEQKFVA